MTILDEDDDHDRGLAFDLPRLRAMRTVSRRSALGLFGAGTAGAVLLGYAPSSGAATARTPQETGGPFPADGSNGPNVLDDSGVVRYDIRKPYGSAKAGTAGGTALRVVLRILNASTGKPRSGAAVYLWHANRLGDYSLYSSGYTNTNYLRGIQVAGTRGYVGFQTVFPACYSGRWPHIHYEVYPSLANARTGSNRLLTSQLAMPAHSAQAVYKSSLYPGSSQRLSQTSLSSDMVFSDGYSQELPTMTGRIGHDYAASLTVYV